MSLPSPEQTASLFSLATYSFLDGLVWKASKLSHLPVKELPPLADYAHTAKLVESFPVEFLRSCMESYADSFP